MDYTKELCNLGLTVFGVEDEIVNISPFFQYIDFNINPSLVKVILKVELKNGEKLVLRITKENHIDNHLAETQYRFSQTLLENGINTAKRYQVNDKYVFKCLFHGHEINIALEEYVGDSLKELTLPLLKQLGSLQGKMHNISEKHQLQLFHDGYVFNLLGKNEVIALDKLNEIIMPHSQYKGLLEEINQEYHILFNEISQKVQQLNKYAVQGDINASNVSLKDGELYIFDFNIACDEYLIIQAVLEGLCLSYEEKYSDHSTVEERFIAFISGYQKERQPNQTEKELIPLIYKVANTLWFTKIQYHNDSIESLLQQSNDQAVKNILHFMLQSLKK